MAKAHSTVIDAGLIQAHVGSRAATIEWPAKATRVELADLPKIHDLLDRIARSLVSSGN